jgi:hypothetical protein
LAKKTSTPKIIPRSENHTQIPSNVGAKLMDNEVVKIQQIKTHIDNSTQLFRLLFLKRNNIKPITTPTIAEYKSIFRYTNGVVGILMLPTNTFHSKANRIVIIPNATVEIT